eukprot:121494-Pelagomonas_calceolata.AAC.1
MVGVHVHQRVQALQQRQSGHEHAAVWALIPAHTIRVRALCVCVCVCVYVYEHAAVWALIPAHTVRACVRACMCMSMPRSGHSSLRVPYVRAC